MRALALICRACSRWVCIWSAVITAPARSSSGIFLSSSRKTGISFVFATFTGSWAAVVPSSQIPDSSIGARPPRGAAPRSAFPSMRRCLRRPGRSARARAAAHAHSASSYWPWSTVAEDAAERGGVRAARPPGPVLRRAQPQQQLLRRRRDPFPGRVQLAVPGHARGQRQRQHVVQRVHAAPPLAGITDGCRGTAAAARARASSQQAGSRNPHQLPSVRRRPPGSAPASAAASAARPSAGKVPRAAGPAAPAPAAARAGTPGPPEPPASPPAAPPGPGHGTARAWQTGTRGVPSGSR